VTVDLHLHSSASDGTDRPSDLMAEAHRAGVRIAALCDHDTTAGLAEAAEAASSLGMEFVPGIELSVDHDASKIHMLVYFVGEGSSVLEDRLRVLRDGRRERNLIIVDRLVDLGYDITMEDVRRQAGGPSVGRPHIADALVEKGYFAHRDAVFATLLHDGGPAYVERTRLGAVEAIGLARDIGGVPVIAHPVTIGVPEDGYLPLFRALRDEGLGGIEAHHPMHTPALREHLVDMASGLGIAATGGSDYHGTGKRSYRIGSGTGDLRVPIESYEQLVLQRGR
jgi:3',5'-nucleoside bisphosphate phosphatase